MAEQPVLIAAASGRALAVSARRGGYAPLVADWFGDADTLAVSARHVQLGSGLAGGMQQAELMAALDRLAAGVEPCGLVCGTGFEDRPGLLARLAERWPLLGNDAAAVRQVKDPLGFARLCALLAVAHPETGLRPPDDPAGWLCKRHGGAGGSHIRRAGAAAEPGYYHQREVAGAPVSALFLAHAGEATVLGFSAQWCAPTPLRPYRYGGAVRPAPLAPQTTSRLVEAVQRLAAAVPLVGLNSADFLVDGGAFRLLEVNPRPGATLDIFEPCAPGAAQRGLAVRRRTGAAKATAGLASGETAAGTVPARRCATGVLQRVRETSIVPSLFALHVRACGSGLPAQPPSLGPAAASAIVYADTDIHRLPAADWPDWVSDRPHAGAAIRAGEPLCSVHAAAETAAEAKRLVLRRLGAVQALMQASAA